VKNRSHDVAIGPPIRAIASRHKEQRPRPGRVSLIDEGETLQPMPRWRCFAAIVLE
jgi:hypothetical protein